MRRKLIRTPPAVTDLVGSGGWSREEEANKKRRTALQIWLAAVVGLVKKLIRTNPPYRFDGS
jgi:hypothetical protein